MTTEEAMTKIKNLKATGMKHKAILAYLSKSGFRTRNGTTPSISWLQQNLAKQKARKAAPSVHTTTRTQSGKTQTTQSPTRPNQTGTMLCFVGDPKEVAAVVERLWG